MKIKQKPSLHATWIDPQARDLVQRLQQKGFTTYLVGGCVRDLLSGIPPKDFDIVTNALPDQVRRSIRGSHVIGRRFRLVLVRRGQHQFEIATFRRASRPEDFVEGEDQPVGDNFFGTAEEDALRRDFTCNALFYDPIRDELIDYAQGLTDIEQRILRVIGEPEQRIVEDPIRSLRAIRLSHKLKMQIEPSLKQAILNKAQELAKSPLARKREEYMKILRLADPLQVWMEMSDLQLLPVLFPQLAEIAKNSSQWDEFQLVYSQLQEALPIDKRSTVELATPMLVAFLQALHHDSKRGEKLEVLMREELGMFRAEISDFQMALELTSSLPSPHSFAKRGSRRRRGFLTQPHLHLALVLAQFDFRLSPEELYFWQHQWKTNGKSLDGTAENSNDSSEPQADSTEQDTDSMEDSMESAAAADHDTSSDDVAVNGMSAQPARNRRSSTYTS